MNTIGFGNTAGMLKGFDWLIPSVICVILVAGIIVWVRWFLNTAVISVKKNDWQKLKGMWLPFGLSQQMIMLSNTLKNQQHSYQIALLESETISGLLSRNEHQLRMVSENVLDGIVTFNKKGGVTSFNSAAEKMYGYSASQMMNLCINDFIHDDEKQYEISLQLKTLRKGISSFAIEPGCRTKGINSSQLVFPVDITLNYVDSDDEESLILVIRDISERQQIESRLMEQQALKSAIIDNSLNAIVTMSTDGIIRDFNSAATDIFGYRAEEAVGFPMANLIIPENYRNAHREGMNRYLNSGKPKVLNQRIEIEALKKDGSVFPIELTIFSVSFNNEKLFAAAIQDITRRREAEESLTEAKVQAEQASRAKTRFVATMSHEIRTPLNAILGILGLIKETSLDKLQQKYVHTALESSQALLGIINDVLDFSKVEAGKMQLESVDFKFSNLVQNVVELLSPKLADRDLELATCIDNRIYDYLSADAGRLRQILMNLVGNAIKFTPQGQIAVCARLLSDSEDNCRVEISVTDTGIGIAKDQQDRLFSEFTQIEQEDTRRYGGTGLGLAISRRLVKLMGGNLELESDEDKGSCFSFSIRLNKTHPLIITPANNRIQGTCIALFARNTLATATLRKQLLDLVDTVDIYETIDALDRAMIKSLHAVVIAQESLLQDLDIDLPEEARFKSNHAKYILLSDQNRLSAPSLSLNQGYDEIISNPASRSRLFSVIRKSLGQDVSDCEVDERNSESIGFKPVDSFRILLAEDSQANQLVIVSILEKYNFHVDAVANGFEALQAVKKLPYDLVLMDLQMPEMDGIEATHRIRSLPGDVANIPIVAMTANVFQEDKDRCEAAGMQDFIGKPIDRQELFTVLGRFTRSKFSGSIKAEDKETKPEPVAELEHSTEHISRGIVEQLLEDTSRNALKKMSDIFVKETTKRLDLMLQAQKSNDIEKIASEAHTLKSSAGSYGAMELQRRAKELELMAKDNKMPSNDYFLTLEKNVKDSLSTFVLLVEELCHD